MPKQKPMKIEAGKAYRTTAFGSRVWGQSVLDKILYVERIEGTKQQRVFVHMIYPAEGSLGWSCTSYTDFLRLAHSEAPTTIN